MLKEFKHEDFGNVKFGTTYLGKAWMNIPEDWLKYVMSDDCRTEEKNKIMAGKVLEQKKICHGQLEFF